MVPQLPMAPAVPTQAVPQSPWGEAANKSDDGGFVAVKTRIVYRKQSGNAFVLGRLRALLAAAAGGLGQAVRVLEQQADHPGANGPETDHRNAGALHRTSLTVLHGTGPGFFVSSVHTLVKRPNKRGPVDF